MSQNREQAIEAVLALVNAERWSETMEILEEHKTVLWSADADEIFSDLLAQNAGDAGGIAQINWQREVLQAARSGGMQAAYARAKGHGARVVIDTETLQLVQNAIQSGNQQELDDVLDRYPYLIPVLEKISQSPQP